MCMFACIHANIHTRIYMCRTAAPRARQSILHLKPAVAFWASLWQ